VAGRHAWREAGSSASTGTNGVAVTHGFLSANPMDVVADGPGLPDGDVLVAAEVARLLRMNVKTVYDLARAGELPCWRLGRHFRFSRGAIVARLAECKAAPHRKGK
jgi:excisionase family DNA binding protein